VVVETPIPPSAVPVSLEEPEKPLPVAHCNGDLGFLANLKPESQEQRERQSVLLSRVHALEKEINGLADDIQQAKHKRLTARLEEVRQAGRKVEDEIADLQKRKGELLPLLNLAGQERSKAEAQWREAKGATPGRRFPNEGELRKLREREEKCRLALLKAQESYDGAVGQSNLLDLKLGDARKRFGDLCYEEAVIVAALTGKRAYDRFTNLPAVPTDV
jgi:chromosome segregation ATPase